MEWNYIASGGANGGKNYIPSPQTLNVCNTEDPMGLL